MGWWAACIVISKVAIVSAGVVCAVGLVGYGIYKVEKYMHEKGKKNKYKHENGKKIAASDITNYGDIKAEAQDTKQSRSNTTKEVIQNRVNESKSVTKQDNNVKDVSRESPKVQTVGEQEFQTEPFMPIYENCGINIDDTASVASSATFDGTESTCDSFASTETVMPDINLDILDCKIPTWHEMSDADKELCLCKCCEKPISTIAISCMHPFLCEECAPIVLPFHNYCLCCEKEISGYQSVLNV